MDEVFIVDRVVIAPGCAQRFLDAYLAGYAPGARARGMTLRDVLVSPPIWFDDRTNTVTITWTLPDAAAWWRMTWCGRSDPSLAEWWDSISDFVVERERSVAGRPDNVVLAADDALVGATGSTALCVTRLVDVAETDRVRVLDALRVAAHGSGAFAHVVAPTLPGTRNGGDILVHLRFHDQQSWEQSTFDEALADPAITHVNGATYHGTPTRRGSGTVYRTLLLRVDPAVDDATVARFEGELLSMPGFVATIAAWQLSRVDTAMGSSPWTHVFEQEFTDVDGLLGPYLMHPIHWTVVDRWFDPETTDVIVRDRLCHSFCELQSPVL
ncbi:Dabb family protein [Mycolicibacterium sp. 141076]|uniref:Dabb family protein n=1 Tax=Mycobacteriaceae TaxID=1762 RepID=UPI00299D7E1B|nr:Dabb family protein [Mycolicibacterium sp. 141076]MDX1877771.1 Dabb family protein [Mycolicibacterium sp. 141076]